MMSRPGVQSPNSVLFFGAASNNLSKINIPVETYECVYDLLQLINRRRRVETQIEQIKETLQNLADAEEEVLISFEPGGLMVVEGECFAPTEDDIASAAVLKLQKIDEARLAKLSEEDVTLESRIKEMRAELHAVYGDQLHLGQTQ
eukprot:Lankesteria_metandrocarpae@DN253_c0_g1_i1.p2